MEFVFIGLIVALIIWFVFSTFRKPNIWLHTTFRGYRKIVITDWPRFGGKSIVTITKDGTYAPYAPQFPKIKGFTLHSDGNANHQDLSFKHATWKYV